MKKLLVLAAGVLQIPIIKKARSMGYYVIAADAYSRSCGFPYANKAVCTDITDEATMLRIAKEEKIDGVIHPCSEVAMNVMGRINDELSLSGISKEQAIRATNKYMMRKAFEKFNAPSPKSILTFSAAEAWRIFCDEFKTGAILKPSRNSGSRGIAKIEKDIDLDLFDLMYGRALSESRDRSVLIEQFIEGPEFSVEIIVWKGKINVLTVTDKKTSGAPYFVELGHSQPSCSPEGTINMISSAAIAGVKALQINNCACHAEVKVQNGKAYLMEIGARLGGDFISTVLTHLSTGIDMTAAAINCAMGVTPYLRPIENRLGVCIRYFCPAPGKLQTIDNVEILNNPHVYDFEIYRHPGDNINEVRSSSDRSGHIIVTEDTPQKAIALAERLIDEVIFEIA